MSRQIYRIYRSTHLISRNIFEALPFDRPFLLPHQKPYRPYLSCHSRSCWNARRWRVISSLPSHDYPRKAYLSLPSIREKTRIRNYDFYRLFIARLFPIIQMAFNLKRSMKKKKRKGKERKTKVKEISFLLPT